NLQIADYVFLLRATNGTAEFQEEWGICNGTMGDDGRCQPASKNPVTYNPDQTFKIQLPANAEIEQAVVMRPGSNPLNTSPVPAGKPGLYYFAYPLRPGNTTFSMTYHVPYSGTLTIAPQPQYKFRELGIAVPESVKFKTDSSSYKPT